MSDPHSPMSDRYSSSTVTAVAVLLDVTLRRNGQVKRWTITTAFPDGWACRLTSADNVHASSCSTEDQIVTKQRDWRADINAARADGWT